MLYQFNISSEDIINVPAPTEEDAWDRFYAIIETPLEPNVINVTCTCIGEE